MRFVVCLDPMVKFLFQKSLPLLSPEVTSSLPVKRYLTNQVLEPSDLRQFIDSLTAVQTKLVEADQFYKIIVFRKYVGIQGILRGLLDLLQEQGHEVFVVMSDAPYQQRLQELVPPRDSLDDVRCIASLNMDENEDFNKFILKTYKLPVYL